MKRIVQAAIGIVVLCCAASISPAETVKITVEYKCPAGVPSVVTVNAPGGQVVARNDKCTVSGLSIRGVAATNDNMVASGFIVPSPLTWNAHGYEVGYLANNDMYLASWEENGSQSGSKVSLKYTSGTGVAQGIKGKLDLVCQPASAGFVNCKGEGYYSLPPAAASNGNPPKSKPAAGK
jgi:hypothetical protein